MPLEEECDESDPEALAGSDDDFAEVPDAHPLLDEDRLYRGRGGRVEPDPKSNGWKLRCEWTLTDGTQVTRFYPVIPIRKQPGRLPFQIGKGSNLAHDLRLLGKRQFTYNAFVGVEADLRMTTVRYKRSPDGKGRVRRDPSTYYSKVGEIIPVGGGAGNGRLAGGEDCPVPSSPLVSSPLPSQPFPSHPIPSQVAGSDKQVTASAKHVAPKQDSSVGGQRTNGNEPPWEKYRTREDIQAEWDSAMAGNSRQREPGDDDDIP
jgi:hypothetical protein